MPNKTRLLSAAACLLLTAALVGCEDGRVRPPRTTLRVVHAAPTTGTINFLRERSSAAELEWRESSPTLVVDEDQYDFNVEYTPPSASRPTTLKTFSQEVLADNDYVFVLTEVDGNIEPVIVENPLFESTSETEVLTVHAAPSLGSVDVYVEPAGADLTVATPVGSVAFRQDAEPVALEPGDYRVTLTAQGDPAAVLYESVTLALGEGDSNALVIFDGPTEGLMPVGVVVSGPEPGVLIDADSQSGLVALNTAGDGAARDLFVDGDFSAPAIGALAYGASSALTSLVPGESVLAVTPAGNVGVVEDELEINLGPGRRYTALVAGAPGEVTVTAAQDDVRRITHEARIRFMNGSSRFAEVEFFLVTKGTDITDRTPLISLESPSVSQRVSIPPGEYELSLRDADTEIVVAGPQLIEVAGAGLYSVLAADGADPGTAEAMLLGDFQ